MTLDKLRLRFESKYRRGAPDECWEWQAGRSDRQGHGYFNAKKQFGATLAHRVAYILAIGPIPVGEVVRHTCDNPPCVNPAHLIIGTQAENIADCVTRNRRARRKPRMSKLSDEQVREIRRRYAAGERQYPLAAEFEVNQSTISDIVSGKLLTAVPD